GNIHEDGEIGGAGTTRSDVEFDNGYGGALTLGYGYSNNLRSEIELSYGKNDVDTVSGATSPSGDVSKTSGMLNLLYDFPGLGRWTPYVGGGFGATNAAVESGATYSGTRVTIDDDDWTWAAQGIAGVGYQLTSNLGMFADYRYFLTGDAEYRTSQNLNTESDFTEHRVMVGLRWFFGAPAKPMPAAAPAPMAAPAPAPAPVAAPAPAPARNYIVFFDFDKADLKSDAQTVVRQAAAGFKNSQGVTRIEATGHADRSGTPAYNQKISQRRAEAVRAELVAQGVPANAISISARGETQPLVQTADGVREPQNRRVEIVLR
ncbi:MAG: outer rane beta-barrel protein, partial [Rhodospirillales bacterium]|nr:outer rane beta-barrel protein [Rhodospirillales bacterium]MCE3258202.1 outer rane beta-barrel protein [Nitrobacter vulgaris]